MAICAGEVCTWQWRKSSWKCPLGTALENAKSISLRDGRHALRTMGAEMQESLRFSKERVVFMMSQPSSMSQIYLSSRGRFVHTTFRIPECEVGEARIWLPDQGWLESVTADPALRPSMAPTVPTKRRSFEDLRLDEDIPVHPVSRCQDLLRECQFRDRLHGRAIQATPTQALRDLSVVFPLAHGGP